MLPSKYGKGGEGVVIRYATGRCSPGRILIAEDRQSLGDRLMAVTSLIEHPGGIFSLPLDLQGTVLQRRVWHELQTLLPGTTIGYADLARRTGSPDAVRGVPGA